MNGRTVQLMWACGRNSSLPVRYTGGLFMCLFQRRQGQFADQSQFGNVEAFIKIYFQMLNDFNLNVLLRKEIFIIANVVLIVQVCNKQNNNKKVICTLEMHQIYEPSFKSIFKQGIIIQISKNQYLQFYSLKILMSSSRDFFFFFNC